MQRISKASRNIRLMVIMAMVASLVTVVCFFIAPASNPVLYVLIFVIGIVCMLGGIAISQKKAKQKKHRR